MEAEKRFSSGLSSPLPFFLRCPPDTPNTRVSLLKASLILFPPSRPGRAKICRPRRMELRKRQKRPLVLDDEDAPPAKRARTQADGAGRADTEAATTRRATRAAAQGPLSSPLFALLCKTLFFRYNEIRGSGLGGSGGGQLSQLSLIPPSRPPALAFVIGLVAPASCASSLSLLAPVIDLTLDEVEMPPAKPSSRGRRVVRASTKKKEQSESLVKKAKEQSESLAATAALPDSGETPAPKRRGRGRPRKIAPVTPVTPVTAVAVTAVTDDAMDIDEPHEATEAGDKGPTLVPTDNDEAQEKEELPVDLAEGPDLPEEIWHIIFNHIDQGRLSILPQVCKTWYIRLLSSMPPFGSLTCLRHKVLSRDIYWVHELATIGFHATVSESEEPPSLQNARDQQYGYVPKNLLYTYEDVESEEDTFYPFTLYPSTKRKYNVKASVHSMAIHQPGRSYKVSSLCNCPSMMLVSHWC